MECKECKWIEISNYKFKDKTRSVVCIKYNKFLGFTNKKGQVVEVKQVNECSTNGSIIRKIETHEKKKSGVVGITWSDRYNSWKTQMWVKELKKHKFIGYFKDLNEAIDCLEKAKKEERS